MKNIVEKKIEVKKSFLEEPGFEPGASRMRIEHSSH